MESMAGGVPVIATDIRGNRDLLKDGGGILYEVGNVHALRSAMNQIVSQPEVAKQMGAMGAKIVQSYDFDKVLKMHETLYEEALSRRNAYLL